MLTVGQILASKYRVLATLGQGGMGEVALAEHLVTGRRVAVKVILGAADPATQARFDREARAMAAIESPHIVGVLDAGADEQTGQRFLVMEYLRGRDLATTLARVGPLASGLVARVALQACAGLARAHAAGFVHRDLKPANIFLADKDGEVTVKLLDFGVAKAGVDAGASHALTRTGHLVGSPHYMSPEQVAGDVTLDGRSDLFSLGVVMYELLTGAAPHAGVLSFPKLLLAVSTVAAPTLEDTADVDPGLARVVQRALALDREARWESADDLREALSKIVGADTRIQTHELGITLEDAAPPRVTVPPISGFATTELATASTTAASVRRPSAPPPRAPRWPIGAGIAIAGIALGGVWLRVSSAPPHVAEPARSPATTPSASDAPPSASAPVAASASATASAATPHTVDPPRAARSAAPPPTRAAPSPAPPTSAPPTAATPAPAKTRVDVTQGFE